MSDKIRFTLGRIETVARQLERMAICLAADVRPGHVDYISKAEAAKTVAALCLDLGQIVHDIEKGE